MHGTNRFAAEPCRHAKSRRGMLRPRTLLSSLLAVDKSGSESYGAFSAFAQSAYMAKCSGRIAIRSFSCPLAAKSQLDGLQSPERP